MARRFRHLLLAIAQPTTNFSACGTIGSGLQMTNYLVTMAHWPRRFKYLNDVRFGTNGPCASDRSCSVLGKGACVQRTEYPF